MDKLLIETDSPYLSPVPMRGKRNEPAFTAYTLAKVAELRETAPDRMAQQLWENSNRILGLE